MILTDSSANRSGPHGKMPLATTRKDPLNLGGDKYIVLSLSITSGKNKYMNRNIDMYEANTRVGTDEWRIGAYVTMREKNWCVRYYKREE